MSLVRLGLAAMAALALLGGGGCTILLGENKDFHGSGAGGGSTSSSEASSSSAASSSSSSSGSPCTDGATQSCYTGPASTGGVGACKLGQETCQDGAFGACLGQVTPAPENCASDLDQDCDGKVSTCTGTPISGGKTFAGATGENEAEAIVVDSTGDVIVGGYFSGGLDFGDGSVNAVGGGQDAFVARYDRTANVVWMKHFGQMGNQEVRALAVDATDDVIVTGNFQGTIAFSSASGPGLFVAKLDRSGNVVWGHGYPGCNANGIAVSKDGTIAVVGQVWGNTMIGSTAVATSSPGDFDGVVFTLDPSGAVRWVKQIKDAQASSQALYGVDIDSAGRVVVNGWGAGSVDFGDGIPIPAPSAQPGSQAIAAAVYRSDGTLVWKQLWGGSPVAIGVSAAFGPGGDVFMTGTFQGGIALGGKNLAALGSYDIFVTRVAAQTGAPIWAQSFGGGNGSQDIGESIAVDAYSVVVGGFFEGPLTAGGIPLYTPTSDAFAVKLLLDGTVRWAKQPVSGSVVWGDTIAFDRSTTGAPGSTAISGKMYVNGGTACATSADCKAPGYPLCSGGVCAQASMFFSRLAP